MILTCGCESVIRKEDWYVRLTGLICWAVLLKAFQRKISSELEKFLARKYGAFFPTSDVEAQIHFPFLIENSSTSQETTVASRSTRLAMRIILFKPRRTMSEARQKRFSLISCRLVRNIVLENITLVSLGTKVAGKRRDFLI